MSATTELIQSLCTHAGMIMEDASVDAISVVSPNAERRQERLVTLRQAADDIGALVGAAEVLHRQFKD